MWPGYALRSLGLLALVVGVLLLLGGLVQINPIWEWGPYHPYQSFNGAQPDWYLGWLIGGLRLMFPFEPHTGGYTLVPNPFWGGALFPIVVFAVLYAWPWLERWFITHDVREHHLLDRPRDNPTRTAVGAAFFCWVFVVFASGAFDRVAFRLWIPYEGQIWFWRFACVLVPMLVFFVTRRVCRELNRSDVHPLRGWYGSRVTRGRDGGFIAAGPAPPAAQQDDEEAVGAASDGRDADRAGA
jgi:ubiquinol-cytochrome c reductase cytochrome b subunit